MNEAHIMLKAVPPHMLTYLIHFLRVCVSILFALILGHGGNMGAMLAGGAAAATTFGISHSVDVITVCLVVLTSIVVYITDDFLLLSGVALLEHSFRMAVTKIQNVSTKKP
ncbi:hypothetical protein R6Q59_006509 [Mikania micrantha]